MLEITPENYVFTQADRERLAELEEKFDYDMPIQQQQELGTLRKLAKLHRETPPLNQSFSAPMGTLDVSEQ